MAPTVAGSGPDDGLIHASLAHQFLRLDTVLLRPHLKIQIVEQPHLGPELLLLPVAQLLGKPAHHMLHRNGVAEVEGLLIILGQQCPSLLSCHRDLLPNVKIEV